MNYLQIDKSSISNGLGVRVVLWVSGCTIGCPGCQNPETWPFDSGRHFDNTAKEKLFQLLERPYIKGLTLTGGHPLECQNQSDVKALLEELHERYPEKDVWLYTGLKLYEEELIERNNQSGYLTDIIRLCDVVVDGPFERRNRDVTLAFRGSTNQRVIDAKETLKRNKIVLLFQDE